MTSRADNRRVLTVLVHFGRKHRRWFVGALILLAIEAGAAVFEAWPLAYLVDFLSGRRSGIASTRNGTVAILSVLVLLIASVNSLADSMAEIWLAKAGRRMGLDLRVALYEHLTKLSMSFHDRRRTGDILTRLTGDVSAIEDFVVKSFSDLAGSLFIVAGTLVFIGVHSIAVTVVAVAIVPFIASVSLWFSIRIKSAAKRQRAREGDLASDAQEMLGAIRVIHSFGRAARQERDFAEHSESAMDAAISGARLEAGFSWSVSVLQALSTISVIWTGLVLIDHRSLTVGTLLLFIILIQNMFKPTRRIIKEWNSIAKVYASVERVADLLDRAPDVVESPDAVEAPTLTGRVEFRSVRFAYDAGGETVGGRRSALDAINFSMEPGKMVALVGPSGAGKSTIAQLVPRLYDPTGGQVLVDGVDLKAYTLASLRAQIGVVLQETVLLTGTVAENIAFGEAEFDLAMIKQAAIRANAHEFIEQLPEGYDTILSERAANLSGGQRQRLSIARAFIRDAPILILDEPTTGLDAGSVDQVLEALHTLVKGRTTLVITHDLGLTRAADRILVLDGGRIVEDGDHHTLVRSAGLYASLYARQLAYDRDSVTSGESELLEGEPALVHPQSTGTGPSLDAVVRSGFPGFGSASDPNRMRDVIDGLLAPGYHVANMAVGKFRYDSPKRCFVRYDVDLVYDFAKSHTRHSVAAWMFSEPGAATAYATNRLAPLLREVQAHDEVNPFSRPMAVFESINTVVFVHPLDGELNTLVEVTSAAGIASVIQRSCKAMRIVAPADPGRVELVKYARHNRSVLRVVADESAGLQFYAKVFGDATLLPDRRAIARLREVGRIGRLERFDVPRDVLSDRRLRLSVMEAMPGRRMITGLIRATLDPPNGDSHSEESLVALALQDSVRICARVAAELHQSGAVVRAQRGRSDDRATLDEELWGLADVEPRLADVFLPHLQSADAIAHQIMAHPMVLIHGDFTPSQLLFHDAGTALLDYDTLAMGEPHLDLGRFVAYVRLSIRKAVGGGHPMEAQLSELFLGAYLEVAEMDERDERAFRTLVSLYEVSSLIRAGLHAARHLKQSRLDAIIAALDETSLYGEAAQTQGALF